MLVLGIGPSVAVAGGVSGPTVTLSTCSSSLFESAISQLLGSRSSPSSGGTIDLACSGVLQVPSPVVIATGQGLAVNAQGHSVTFVPPPYVPGSPNPSIGDEWQSFDVAGGTLELVDLTFTGDMAIPPASIPGAVGGGNAPDAGQGPDNFQKGGMIYIASKSTVTITGSTFESGQVGGYTAGGGGAATASGGTGGKGGKGGSGEGGAIYNAGTLIVTGSSFTDNVAGGGSGGYGGCGGNNNGTGGSGGSGAGGGKGKGLANELVRCCRIFGGGGQSRGHVR